MTFGEFKRGLSKDGCRFHHQGGRHEMWENPKTGAIFPVGRHNSKEIKKGTAEAIRKAAGLK